MPQHSRTPDTVARPATAPGAHSDQQTTRSDMANPTAVTATNAARRRRAATRRLCPFDCGCVDPWTCRCAEPPSPCGLDAWADAIGVLLEHDRTPIVPVEVLRALWRRGGCDRVLAEAVHARTGGAVA